MQLEYALQAGLTLQTDWSLPQVVAISAFWMHRMHSGAGLKGPHTGVSPHGAEQKVQAHCPIVS